MRTYNPTLSNQARRKTDLSPRILSTAGLMKITELMALSRASFLSSPFSRRRSETHVLSESEVNGKYAFAPCSMSVQFDIYKEIPFAMLGKTVVAFSVPPVAASSVPSSSFTNALQEIPFSVYLLPYCEFFHIGTSKQLIQNFHTINYTASTYGFQNFSKAIALDKSELGNAFVYNSLINTASI